MPRKVKGADLAYTAGIVDGEGSIGFVRVEQRKRFQLVVSVTNTNEWLIRWLKFSFGGSIYVERRKGKDKDLWFWQVNARKALEFLKLILPYLKLKRPQAELGIKFTESRPRYLGRHKTEEERAVDEATYIVMRQYNKRGK